MNYCRWPCTKGRLAGSIISGAALSAIRTLIIDIAPNMYLSHKMQTIYYGLLVDEGWGIFGDVTNHYGVYNESILGL